MTKTILATKFNYSMPTDELKKIMPAIAPEFSEIPGCCWKIWIFNEDRREAGGIYLFESLTELKQYLNSDFFESVTNNQAFSNLQINTFCVAEAASLITGAPLLRMDV